MKIYILIGICITIGIMIIMYFAFGRCVDEKWFYAEGSWIKYEARIIRKQENDWAHLIYVGKVNDVRMMEAMGFKSDGYIDSRQNYYKFTRWHDGILYTITEEVAVIPYSEETLRRMSFDNIDIQVPVCINSDDCVIIGMTCRVKNKLRKILIGNS